MYPDVVDLREFYESDLGAMAQRIVRAQLRALWPNVQGQALLGLGYATPYLRPFLGEASRVMALMPGPQGVTWWPREGPNRTALTEETDLPLADQSVDRLLLVHDLENTENISGLLNEAWRVLSPTGRMIVIAPQRSGSWAHDARTPFGFGFSFSLPHLKRTLANNRFQPERHLRCLYTPPFMFRILASHVDWIERQGTRFLPGAAGVLLIEAGKQAYARPAREKVRVAGPALLPMRGLITPTSSREKA